MSGVYAIALAFGLVLILLFTSSSQESSFLYELFFAPPSSEVTQDAADNTPEANGGEDKAPASATETNAGEAKAASDVVPEIDSSDTAVPPATNDEAEPSTETP